MPFEPGESTKSAGFRRLQYAAVIAALLFVVGTICVVIALQVRPKPFVLPFTAADVESLAADGVYLRNQDVNATFQVPPSFWEAILATFSGASKDEHPAKWVVNGELHVKKKDGSTYFIMYSDRDEFAAGPTHGQRVYYRGTDNAELEQAVVGAYEASHKKK
jgi:hypothetical protein